MSRCGRTWSRSATKSGSDEHAADALAVAYETMHRVEQNVRIIAERLTVLGYAFRRRPAPRSGLFGLGKPKVHAAARAAGAATARTHRRA